MTNFKPDVKSVFGRAAEIASPADRAAFLDEAVAGHPNIRAEVEILLKALGDAGSFMGFPAAPAGETADFNTPIAESEGTIIGPFTLRERIGEGGMGLVFVAEQTQPVRRKVALKVIKPGMDTKQVVARFEAERQALAMMDHPNIARVLDAGTTQSGRPFFVMELVRGVPITEYCDANNLSPRARLGLFVQVCHAVQHAHQKGVIHRDLKPTNILVAPHDGVPVVKVIDFGVAKALGQSLTEKTIYTRFAQMVGTPLYMSPEQAEVNQLDVDTRSDVYALGVLLYELLTGTTPFDGDRFRKAAFDEIRRIIREEEPPRPSTRLTTLAATLTSVSARRGTDPGRLSALVRGELDWIVMRCLEKDRTRRYDTATALAKDVQRYLAGEAVEACPPTLGYRLKKAYRRNRPAILGAGAIAAVLLAAAGVSVAFGVQATRAEGQAEQKRKDADDNAARADENMRTAKEKEEQAQREAANVKAEQERIRRLLYAAEMASASYALVDGRGESVLQVLRSTTPKPGEPDLRGWEWHFLNRLYTSNVRELRLGAPLPDDNSQGANLALGTRTVVTRYDAKSIWFEVFDTAAGKQMGRIPKEGPLPGWDPSTMLPPGFGQPGTPRIVQRRFPNGVLDPGGRYLATLFPVRRENNQLVSRVRLWRVDSGEELLDVPGQMAKGAESLTLGPDAGWIAWLDTAKTEFAGFAAQPNNPVTFRRWDRTKETLTSRTFTPKSVGISRIAQDGRYVLFDRGGWPWQDKRNIDPLKCWDVAADPPTVTDISIPDCASGSTAVSPNTAFVAIQADHELVVKSLPDGNVFWQHTLASTPGGGWEAPRRKVVGISDDGRRVVFASHLMLTVIEQPNPAKPIAPREWVVRDRRITTHANGNPTAWWDWQVRRTDSGISAGMLSPDGRTMYHHTGSGTTVLAIDLSDDPQWAGPASRPQRMVRVAGPSLFSIQDADGKEIGQSKHFDGNFLVRDRWIVLNPVPFGKQQGAANTWECFDTADSKKGLRLVATGDGVANVTPDGRWLIGCNRQLLELSMGTLRTRGHAGFWTTTTIFNPETGKVVSRIEAPQGMVHTLSTQPGGDLAAAVTFPTPQPAEVESGATGLMPSKPVPLTLRLHEIGTGREIWAKDLGTASPGLGGTVFSRDKRRLFVTTREKDDQGRVRIYKLADGSLEQSFAVPAQIVWHLAGETGDGQLIFAARGLTEIWKPATGARTHSLTGTDPTAYLQVASSPDGKRLFAIANSNEMYSTRLHVWDLTTGREVLNLPLRNAQTASFRPPLEFADGKLRYSSRDGARVLDGRPLPEPPK
jgi:serine/threonine protein kinase